MTEHFFVTCFLIGISAASGLGPIFLLTLNRSSLYGFWKGFATGIGASLADGFYFVLATFGLLSIIESKSSALVLMEGVSSFLLMAFGIHLFRAKPQLNIAMPISNQSFILSGIKAFFLTLLNPFILLFFVFISVNILPPSNTTYSYYKLFMGGACVSAGSLSILSLIALLGSFAGSKINKNSLAILGKITGVIFGLIGVYLLGDFLLKIIKLYQ